MTPEEQIANLKQQLAEAKAEAISLRKSMDTREADNKALRDEIKELKQGMAELEQKLPSKDSVIITSDDAKELESYRELGKPNLVKVKLDDYDRNNNELTRLRREKLIHEASRDPENSQVLRYKPTALEFILKDIPISKGKEGFLVKIGDEDKDLDRWLKEDMSDFLSALQPDNGTPALGQAGNRQKGAPKVTSEEIAEKMAASPEYQSF